MSPPPPPPSTIYVAFTDHYPLRRSSVVSVLFICWPLSLLMSTGTVSLVLHCLQLTRTPFHQSLATARRWRRVSIEFRDPNIPSYCLLSL
ncbi:hypothetical protein B0A54_07651 [Friedmanniomyces endolithicus]|uniref:Uncharacterized protein n=1 Tax=Friedmanniomyces endolithicus TaxID=329885 RepID=A0A4U0UY39_9PEZI|nr:hypothetical protein B0A54_07651 [Friedmanniomyces endolithicus]